MGMLFNIVSSPQTSTMQHGLLYFGMRVEEHPEDSRLAGAQTSTTKPMQAKAEEPTITVEDGFR